MLDASARSQPRLHESRHHALSLRFVGFVFSCSGYRRILWVRQSRSLFVICSGIRNCHVTASAAVMTEHFRYVEQSLQIYLS